MAAPPVITFRVHIVGSPSVDVDATTPQAAAETIRQRDPAALISKIKRVKEKADA